MIECTQPLPGGAVAQLRFTDRNDGDFAIDGDPVRLQQSRRQVSEHPWTWLRQVHGAAVVTVNRPGALAGAEADAGVTATPGAVLAVQTADCVPVLLVGSSGVVGAAHAGWRGAVGGVLDATVQAMVDHGSRNVAATIGPAIGPECYEFGQNDLDMARRTLGDDVCATTADGRPAMNLVAGVAGRLRRLGVENIEVVGGCTACGSSWYSHRARADVGRQVAAVWIESAS